MKRSTGKMLYVVNRQKRNKRLIILEIVMLLLSLVVLLPMAFAVLTSVKTPVEAAKLDFSLPTTVTLDNYKTVLESANVVNGFLMSCSVTFTTIVCTITVSSLAAYVINRKVNSFTKFWYLFFVLGLIPPAFPIPTVKLMQVLGLQGSPVGLILFYTATFIPFSVFLTTGFLKGVPKELDEAAFVDGCGSWRVFWKIIFPTIKPVIFTNVIFLFMWCWNDFTWPLYLLGGGSRSSTLPLTVFDFMAKYSTSWNLVYADLVMVSLPVILIYIFARKYIIEGMVAGSVKG